MIKLTIILATLILSALLSWKVYYRFNRRLHMVQERITPLVWLFGILFVISPPLVAYHTWIKGGEDAIPAMNVQASIPDKNLPNIILVTFDAMTARDMSLYGYHRETTPFITEWSKNATVFTRAKAESTLTTSTFASLLTGKKLWSHKAYHIKSSVKAGTKDNLALELRKNGYYTMMYSENSNGTPKVLGVSNSFDDMTFTQEGKGFLHNYHAMLFVLFHGKIKLYDWLLLDDFYPVLLMRQYYMPIYNKLFGEVKGPFSMGITLLDKFISDIDKKPPAKPFFAWIHLYPPHAPYLPPDPYLGIFEPSPSFRTFSEQRKAETRIREHEKEGLTPKDLRDMKVMRGRYDEHILFCDKEFEDFINNLEKRNLLDSSVIMLSSDHGESFEHGHWAHGKSFYEPVLHIPLIIRAPGQEEGRIVNDLVEQIDITATALDLAGVPAPAWLEGRSLLPLMRGDELPAKPVFSMYFEGSRSRGTITDGFVAVYEGDYKLIYLIEEDRSLLFNLRTDPDEMNDLFNEKSETRQRLLGLVRENIMRANKRIGDGG